MRAGCTSIPSSRASAAPTWPRWTAAARATSRTSSPSRSCPATRWWACCRPMPLTPTGLPWPPAPVSCCSRCSAVPPAALRRRARPAGPVMSATADTWPSVTSGPGCKPASVPTPEAGGRPPAWWPTPASSSPCPTPCRTPTPSRSNRWPAPCMQSWVPAFGKATWSLCSVRARWASP